MDDQSMEHHISPATLDIVTRSLRGVLEEHAVTDRIFGELRKNPEFNAALAEMEKEDAAAQGSANPKPPQGGLSLFVAAVNEEREAGSANAGALLATDISAWGAILRANPSWVRWGTFEALIREAEKHLANAPEQTHAITSFVLGYLDRFAVPEHAEHIAEKLPGSAWLTHAKALIALGRYGEALRATATADAEFAKHPVLSLKRSEALLESARVWMVTGRAADALPVFASLARQFAANTSSLSVDALGAAAEILCRHKEWQAARMTLAVAKRASDRYHSPFVTQRYRDAAAKCAALGLRDDEFDHAE